MDKFFYTIVGAHGMENIEEILDKMDRQIKECGFTLWAASIPTNDIKKVWDSDLSQEILVMGRISLTAKDPSEKCGKKTASYMYTPTGKEKIPNEIKTTFQKSRDKYQAYVVKEIEKLDEIEIINLGEFEVEKKDGKKSSVSNNYSGFPWFQNRLFIKNDNPIDGYKAEFLIRMKLQYPYVVEIE